MFYLVRVSFVFNRFEPPLTVVECKSQSSTRIKKNKSDRICLCRDMRRDRPIFFSDKICNSIRFSECQLTNFGNLALCESFQLGRSVGYPQRRYLWSSWSHSVGILHVASLSLFLSFKSIFAVASDGETYCSI